jgi:hypothetical protein
LVETGADQSEIDIIFDGLFVHYDLLYQRANRGLLSIATKRVVESQRIDTCKGRVQRLKDGEDELGREIANVDAIFVGRGLLND